MKEAPSRVRSLVTILAMTFLFAFQAQAQQEPARQDSGANYLAELHDFRLSNYQSLDAYYRFSASTDPAALNEIVAGVNDANDSMEVIVSSELAVLSPEQLDQLNAEFDSFKDLMKENITVVRNTGYPDLRLSAELAEQAVVLNNLASELYQVAQESGETDPDERVETARSAAVTIARMMTKYSARSNSSVSQAFQGSSSEVALDEQARQFDAMLNKVKAGSAEGELKQLLDEISSKWLFIKGSYINFNEHNVSFVIGRYSQGIIERLGRVITLLENQG
ncbi:MAG TPA: hypothetical protein DHU56_08830 [Marinobacter sp.]|jgi:hypothetical protein|nr:hypothetical protein [Marinobacter sp.]